jgi:hypothetical protein
VFVSYYHHSFFFFSNLSSRWTKESRFPRNHMGVSFISPPVPYPFGYRYTYIYIYIYINININFLKEREREREREREEVVKLTKRGQAVSSCICIRSDTRTG